MSERVYLGIASGLWAIGFAIAVVLVIIVAVLGANPDPKEFVSDMAKIAGIGFTALFSIATFVLTFATERTKLAAARDLEAAKIAATKEIAQAGIAAQKDMEKVRSRYVYELEVGKRRLELETATYQAFTKAAAKFYRAVEDCRFRPAEAEKTLDAANAEMRDADAYNMWLSEDLWNQWYAFWQKGKNLAAELRDCSDDAARGQAWNKSVKEFGRMLKDFQTTFLETSIFGSTPE